MCSGGGGGHCSPPPTQPAVMHTQSHIIVNSDSSTFLLLSLDAHNHVDDYSGTFGGVRK